MKSFFRNKRVLGLFFMTLIVSGLAAHTPILYIEDNGDGTLFVQGGFSNGASAAGVPIFVNSAASGETLWEGILPDIGEMDVEIPGEPYVVVFDAGPGHVVSKDGPLPEGGFAAVGASESEGNGESSNAAASEVNINWTPQDTVSALPDTGTPFVFILSLLISALNFCLLIYLVRKRTRTEF